MNTAALEQALYLEALRRDEERLPMEAAVLPAAAIGAYAGYQAGRPLQAAAELVNKGLDKVSPYRPVTKRVEGKPVAVRREPIPRGGRFGKALPGFKLAGGLTGFLLGGGAGAAVRQAMIDESPEARLLAKIQVGEQLDSYDMALLEDIATKHYDNQSRFSRGMG
tara:strand:- start:2053 stop:2547 length:495 start_codon:yes stop_codon:yes gene_type:complete